MLPSAFPFSWSDGVPMEGVSGIAVLTRISTMALNKAKVMQHEVFFVGPQVSPPLSLAMCTVLLLDVFMPICTSDDIHSEQV